MNLFFLKRHTQIFLGLVFFVLTSKIALGATFFDLKKQMPKWQWSENTAVVLDIDHDGWVEKAYLGYRQNRIVVAVLFANRSKIEPIVFFRNRDDLHNAICGETAQLKIFRQDQSLVEIFGENLLGYQICPSCVGLVLQDEGGCDPIHVFWNKQQKKLDFWRM